MPPNTTNPLVILAWFISLPAVVLVVKAIWFIAQAQKDLKTVVAYVHASRSSNQALDVTLTLIENDINVLQDKTDVAVRVWPDRRVGAADRRTA